MKGCRLQPKMHPFTMRFNLISINTNDSRELPTMEFSKHKICSSNDGGQSTIFQQLKYWLQLWRINVSSQYNVNAIQYLCKIFCKDVQLKTPVQKAFKAAEFSFKELSYNDGKLSSNVNFFKKIILMSMPQII